MPYCVTRQGYWGVDPEDCYTVEIAAGGIDYCNPDALVSKYPGEFQEFTDPREAAAVALEIAEQWQKDCPDIKVNIAHGFTMGYTMPFEPETRGELLAWAEAEFKGLPKCDCCGGLMPGERDQWQNQDSDWSGEKFCSEYCADKAYWSVVEICQGCEKEMDRAEYQEADGLCEECAAKQDEED